MNARRCACLLFGLAGALLACDDGGEASSSDGAVSSDAAIADGAAGPDAVVRGACDTPPVAGGVLRNAVSDIDFAGEPVDVEVQHKLDIDAQEDGCVVGLHLAVQKAGLGCALGLTYASLGGAPIALVEARLAADSFCPGWSDEDEGEYQMADGSPGLDFVTRVPDRTAATSCIGSATLRLRGRVTLRRGDGRALELRLDDLTIRGDFLSAGDTGSSCPCAPACGDRACGPDPVCGASCGDCADAVECTPAGQCGCAPRCVDRECGADGCGGTCGPGCAAGTHCDDGQCVACEPDCSERECGDDSCGGACAPGCADGVTCVDGACAECAPDCAGRACGPDGCGGRCGDGCDSLSECDEGTGRCVDQCPVAVCPGGSVDTPAALAAYADCGAIDGDLFIQDNATNTTAGLECVRTVSGDLSFRFTAIPVVALPRLAEVGGVLRFESDRVTTRISLPALTEVGDTLAIAGLTAVDTLEFPALVRPTGRVAVGDLDQLSTLEGFSALRATSGLVISRMDLLRDLDPLGDLEQLDFLSLQDSPQFSHFDALAGLPALSGGARIIGNDTLRSLAGLSGIARMSSLTIQENRFLPGLEGLEALQEIDTSLTIERNERLLSTGALMNLTRVDRLTLENNIRLEALDLPALTTVGTLSLIALKMTDLDGVSAVRQISGALFIDSNSLLTAVDGLARASVAGNVVVQRNRALATCAAEALVEAVTGPNWRGRATIEGNDDAGGCE